MRLREFLKRQKLISDMLNYREDLARFWKEDNNNK